jgi:hypothetical protein
MATAEKISFAYDLSGYADIVKEFPIAATTAIEKGEVVKIVAGKVVAIGDTDQDDPYLGVAAEPHDGSTDGRQSGIVIKVYCSPTAVFKCKPGIVSTADSGSKTTWVDGELVAGAGFADDDFNGGYIKILTATNLKPKVIEVTDFAVATGTCTVADQGVVVAADDTALLFPPVGSIGWDLNSDGTNVNLKAKGGESLRIVQVDTTNEWVYFMFRLHQLGNSTLAI